MGRRKQPELMDAGTRRASMLSKVSEKVAVQLYDEGMAALAARGDDSFASAALLRDAVQWTEVIERLQHALLFEVDRGDDADDKAIAQLMRRKQAAEDARRRALAGLLLVPQRPRGRPPKGAAAREEEPEDDGWDSFGKTDSADGFDAEARP